MGIAAIFFGADCISRDFCAGTCAISRLVVAAKMHATVVNVFTISSNAA